MSVLFPAPDEPTSAVVEPAGAWNETRFRTSVPATYSKLTFSNTTSHSTSASGAREPSSASSVARRRISRIRSRPANASVICVPIDAMLMSGKATSPMNTLYMKKSPSVMAPERMACPPSRIIRMPIAPMMMVAKAPTAELPVIVVAMFRNIATTMTGISAVGAFATIIIGAIGILMILEGGHAILSGAMTLGDFFMYSVFIGLVALPLINIASIGTQITEAFAGLDRIREIRRLVTEDAEDGARAPLADVAGDVKFENVSFEYVPGAEVLKHISFHAAAGSTTALVGSSGAGKSTLINLVLTFNRPKAGRIFVDGRDLATLRLADYRRQLGVVLQDNFLFDGTIAENIAFARPHATRDDIEEAARIAHCDEFVRRFEKGYDTVVGERGVKLSGGERQRVSIARAILADPRILILDEATSSLDSESEAAIQDGLRTLRRGRTTFVIAHRLSTIESADQILVLDNGVVVERGSHRELLALGGRYRQLYDKQYRFEQDVFVNPGEDFTPAPETPVATPPLTPPTRL